MLTLTLLRELEERWATRHVPLAGRLSPGLSASEIEALMAPLELRLPEEAFLWWSWHDGAPPGSLGQDQDRWLGPGMAYIPLAEAAARYRQRRELARRASETSEVDDWTADAWWHPTWFPLIGYDVGIACDCSVPAGWPTPIRAVDWHGFERIDDLATVRAASLGEMVNWWIEAIDTGAWSYDAQRGWERHYELLDPSKGLTRLV